MQNEEQQKRDLLTIGEASEYLGISIDTLRRWEKKGRIEPLRSPGGHRYFDKKGLDDLFGKRYTRDEPTIRKSTKSEKNIKDVSIPAETEDADKSNGEIKDEIKIETVESPAYGLPHWRAIKEENFEVDIEVTNSPRNDNIADRPTREVKIPEAESIRIITNEKVLTSQEAYYKQQSTSSILSPSEAPSIVESPQYQEVSQKEIAKPAVFLPGKSEEIKKFIENNKVYLIAAFFGVLLLSVVWYLLWRNSQIVLSPVP